MPKSDAVRLKEGKEEKKNCYYREATVVGFRAAVRSWTQVWLNRDQWSVWADGSAAIVLFPCIVVTLEVQGLGRDAQWECVGIIWLDIKHALLFLLRNNCPY